MHKLIYIISFLLILINCSVFAKEKPLTYDKLRQQNINTLEQQQDAYQKLLQEKQTTPQALSPKPTMPTQPVQALPPEQPSAPATVSPVPAAPIQQTAPMPTSQPQWLQSNPWSNTTNNPWAPQQQQTPTQMQTQQQQQTNTQQPNTSYQPPNIYAPGANTQPPTQQPQPNIYK